ncbi:ANTAR domain-containing protein [Ectothiorhodospiraceae bacterium WFHF3C12]|nr:ANTAR domain-containing protein [Ectothiorhodospiraceae bacterium WFHF3C12]
MVHPHDAHAEELLKQVRRIGCHAEAVWPPPKALPAYADMVFLEISENIPDRIMRLLDDDWTRRPTLIGVAGYENPSVLQGVLDMKVEAVLTKPLKAYGVLTSMVMARRIWHDLRAKDRALQKVKEKLRSNQTISQAKFILMRLHGIDEDEAYKTIRSQAMTKRTTTAEIAQAIINADGILGNISSKKSHSND